MSEHHKAALAALGSIQASLRKFSIRRPENENGEPGMASRHVDPGSGDNSEQPGETSEDPRAEATEERSGILTLDAISGEPEMPDGDVPGDEVADEQAEPSPMRMMEYGVRQASRAVAPGGSRPAPPVGRADVPQPAKRPRGRPRKVL